MIAVRRWMLSVACRTHAAVPGGGGHHGTAWNDVGRPWIEQASRDRAAVLDSATNRMKHRIFWLLLIAGLGLIVYAKGASDRRYGAIGFASAMISACGLVGGDGKPKTPTNGPPH